MKIYNAALVQRAARVERWLRILAVVRWLWMPVALLMRLIPGRPAYLVADGYLIGDCVLLRPLLRSMTRTEGRIVYVGGPHAEILLRDIPAERWTYQWPWAVYNRGFASLLRLAFLGLRILFLQPRFTVEPRGDLRNLTFLYLCCVPRIAGYGFTGGRFMLDVEPDLPEIAHLETHNRKLAEALGLAYSVEDVHYEEGTVDVPEKSGIALSFSGSQVLKSMPIRTAADLLGELARTGKPITYLCAPQDHFLASVENRDLLVRHEVKIWSGNFREFVEKIRSAEVYVGMDSGGGHIASVFGIPSLLFFGTMRADYCAPVGNARQVCLETDQMLTCRPCAGVVCTNEIYQRCLTSIPERDLASAVRAVMGSSEKH